MSGNLHRAALRGAAAGTVIVGLAGFAHVSAGGALQLTSTAAVLLAVAITAAALSGRVRFTFPRLLGASLLVQPVLHVAFGGMSGMSGHAAMHHDAAHQHAMATAASGPGLAMLLAHATVSVAAAVALQSGVRWLRSMPALVRAIVVAARGAITPLPQPAMLLAPVPAPSYRSAELRPRHTRGPPV